MEKRDMKKVYDTTRLLSRNRNDQCRPVKDKNGMVLLRIDDQLSQWKEHFQEILNRTVPENPPGLTEEPPLDIETRQITIAEVKRALRKNGKGPGCDILPEA